MQVVWGDTVIDASWNGDEFWTAFADLPSDVEQPLSVLFYDRNGTIELGSVETTLRTGTNESEYIQFEESQMSTNRFDDDLDGRSNFWELGNGSDPLVSNPPVPVTFTSVQSVLGGRCSDYHQAFRGGIAHERLLELENFDGAPFVSPFEPELSQLVQQFDRRFPHVGVSNRSTFPQLLQAWAAKGALDD